jgi:hypothetical protein
MLIMMLMTDRSLYILMSRTKTLVAITYIFSHIGYKVHVLISILVNPCLLRPSFGSASKVKVNLTTLIRVKYQRYVAVSRAAQLKV